MPLKRKQGIWDRPEDNPRKLLEFEETVDESIKANDSQIEKLKSKIEALEARIKKLESA